MKRIFQRFFGKGAKTPQEAIQENYEREMGFARDVFAQAKTETRDHTAKGMAKGDDNYYLQSLEARGVYEYASAVVESCERFSIENERISKLTEPARRSAEYILLLTRHESELADAWKLLNENEKEKIQYILAVRGPRY